MSVKHLGVINDKQLLFVGFRNMLITQIQNHFAQYKYE